LHNRQKLKLDTYNMWMPPDGKSHVV